jgi:hypothetical protein
MRFSYLLLSLLLVGGCFQQDSNKVSQILPLEYQKTYRPVRNCRPIGIPEHRAKYIRVLANSVEAQDAYIAANCPLPQGSVIVAEESDKPDCSKVSGYSLMFKDVPGYDLAGFDWHWQQLDDTRTILQDGHVQECITCHTSCTLNDLTCSPP